MIDELRYDSEVEMLDKLLVEGKVRHRARVGWNASLSGF